MVFFLPLLLPSCIITVMSHEHGISDHWQLCSASNSLNTTKLCITGPLWWESTSDWWIPPTKGQWSRNHFYFMMSSSVMWILCTGGQQYRTVIMSLLTTYINMWINNKLVNDIQYLSFKKVIQIQQWVLLKVWYFLSTLLSYFLYLLAWYTILERAALWNYYSAVM